MSKPRKVSLPKIPQRTEHEIQAAFFARVALDFRLRDLPIYAVPNFAGRLGKATAIHGARLKAEGRKRGVPDVNVDVPSGRFHGLRIEFKRSKADKPRPEQRDWHLMLTTHGYVVLVLWDDAEAHAAVLRYLGFAP